MKVTSLPTDSVKTHLPNIYATPSGEIYSHVKSKTDSSKCIITKYTPTFNSGPKNKKYATLRYHGKTHSWHRLIAMTFIPNPDNKPHVDHINEDHTFNASANLRWCTQEENVHYSIESGGHSCTRTRKPIQQLTISGVLIAEHKSVSSAGKAMNPSNPENGRSNIKSSINKDKLRYGFYWRT